MNCITTCKPFRCACLFFVSLIGLVFSLAAQPAVPTHLMKSTTGSGGGSGSASGPASGKHISLNQTIAQSSLTGKFQAGKVVLLQGFQHALSGRSNQETNEEPLSVAIFPNPSNGNFTIQVPAKLVGSEIVVRLSNFMGQVLREARLTIQQTTVPFDFSELPKAPYVIAIRSTQSDWNHSIIIFQ